MSGLKHSPCLKPDFFHFSTTAIYDMETRELSGLPGAVSAGRLGGYAIAPALGEKEKEKEIVMKIIHFISDKTERLYGAFEPAAPGKARVIEGDILGRFSLTDRSAVIKKILPPIDPPNILALGFSYGKHAGETESKAPESPVLFIKGTNSSHRPGGYDPSSQGRT